MSALGQAGLQELAAGIQLNSGYSEASGRGVLTERGMSRGRDKGCLKRVPPGAGRARGLRGQPIP